MIYIIIPVHNRLLFTANCLRSLEAQTYRNTKIIVVDDGSTDGTAEYVRKNFPEVILLHGTGNLWWTKATNFGVQAALEMSNSNDDYILTLNNDLEVEPDYLSILKNAAKNNPDTLMGSVSVNIQCTDEVAFAGVEWMPAIAAYKHIKNTYPSYHSLRNHEYLHTDLLPGRGTLIPVSVFRKIGMYDDKFFPQYMADEDFSLRATSENYKLLVATQAVVYSHVDDTGLNKQNLKGLSFLRENFTSLKSPNKLSVRWNWAKKHTKLPVLYFCMDFSRLFASHFSRMLN